MQKKKIVQIPNFWTAVYNTVYDTHQRHMNDWNKCDSTCMEAHFQLRRKKVIVKYISISMYLFIIVT